MPEDLLYHYCSLETFLAIVQNKTIRLGDITKSNDAEELTWFSKQFHEFVKAWIDFKYKYNSRNEFESLHNPNDLENPCVIHSKKVEFYDLLADLSGVRICAFCLSEQPDLLSQWRGYADDGKGISIGFKKNAIGKYLSTMDNSFALKKITYDADNFQAGMNQLFDMVDPRSGDPQRFIDTDISDSIRDFAYTAACYKNPSFEEEKEWRIIIDPSEISIDTEFGKKTRIKLRVAGNKIIAYFDLKLDNLPDLIGEVIIGPKSMVAEKDIRLSLSLLGQYEKVHKIGVRSSGSSYR